MKKLFPSPLDIAIKTLVILIILLFSLSVFLRLKNSGVEQPTSVYDFRDEQIEQRERELKILQDIAESLDEIKEKLK
jgi:hypothetical protein